MKSRAKIEQFAFCCHTFKLTLSSNILRVNIVSIYLFVGFVVCAMCVAIFRTNLDETFWLKRKKENTWKLLPKRRQLQKIALLVNLNRFKSFYLIFVLRLFFGFRSIQKNRLTCSLSIILRILFSALFSAIVIHSTSIYFLFLVFFIVVATAVLYIYTLVYTFFSKSNGWRYTYTYLNL